MMINDSIYVACCSDLSMMWPWAADIVPSANANEMDFMDAREKSAWTNSDEIDVRASIP